MAELTTAERLAEKRSHEQAVEEYDRTIASLGQGLQDVIARAGQRWWVKPAVLVDLIENSATEEDLNFVGGLSMQLGKGSWTGRSSWEQARVNQRWQRKYEALQEIARKEADEGFQWGDIADVGKGVVRTAASAVSSLWEEAQGMVRSGGTPGVYATTGPGGPAIRERGRGQIGIDSIEGEGFVGAQSTFGVTIGKLFSGEISPGETVFGDPDALGSGYFPGGDVAREQAERARRSATIDGHALTPGRLAAHYVADPGEWQHRWLSGAIDGGLIVLADPSNAALAKVGKVVQARRAFVGDEAPRVLGLVHGQRRTVSDSVQHWLHNTWSGGRFVDRLTEMSDPVEIWEASRRQIPIEWAVRIADTNERQDVLGLASDFLGTTVRAKPKGWHYTDVGVWVRQRTVDNPLYGQMPRTGRLDTYDPEAFVTQIADELKNAHVPADEAHVIVRNAMKAITSGPPGLPLASERYAVLTAAKDAVAAQLKAAGVQTPKAKQLTRIWDTYDALKRYNIDVLTGSENPLPYVISNGGRVSTVTPQTLEQLLSRYVPLADAQTLRAISKRTGWLADLPAGQLAASAAIGVGLAADSFHKVWKPLQLIRLAYIARVVGDEQARMAAAGLSSMFHSPLSYFALAIMDDGRLGKFVDNWAGKYGADVTGAKFATRAPKAGGRLEAVDESTDFANTLYAGTSDLLFGREAVGMKMPGFISIAQHEEGFDAAWLDEVKFLHDNQIARRIAAGEPLEDVKEWFYTSGYRAAIIGSGDATRFAADEVGAEAAERLSPLARQVSSRVDADRYVDHMAEWVGGVTQGDTALLEAVATGRLPIGATHANRDAAVAYGTSIHRNSKPTQDALNYVRTLMDEGIAPPHVRGAPLLASTKMQSFNEGMRSMIDLLMDVVAVRPSNWASRSPTFRQYYWKRMEELLDLASPQARARIVGKAADEAKLPAKVRDRLRNIPRNPDGQLSLEDLNALASQYAADETKRLLYDLHNRSRFFDATRLIFPFGEAWKEVLQTWGRLITDNPKSLRTLQKTITGARGAGFVYKDEATGEEMFGIPGSAPLVQAATGIRGEFRAPVAGLSIAGSVIPGVGPTMQWAVGTFLPDKPKYKWVRDIVFQFGGEDEGIVKTLVPGWAEKLQRFIGSPESDRQFNNSVGEALNALASTGDYDLQDQADLERLQSDAVEAAKRIWGLRAIFQFIAPSTPSPRLFVETERGDKIRSVLVEEFYRLQNADYETAVQTFVERFGPLALLATVPYTRTEQGGRSVLGLRPTEAFNEFESTHDTLFESFPHVAGLFGPQDPGYDFQVYERQAREYREVKGQTERLEEYNDLLGQMAFDSYKSQLPANPTREQRRWLAEWKRELQQEYPGFGSRPLNLNAVEANVLELRRAAEHPSLEGSDLAAAVNRYMEYRDKAIEASPDVGWSQAQGSRHLRDWLREWADEISDSTPEFRRVWDMLLSRELNDDLEEVE